MKSLLSLVLLIAAQVAVADCPSLADRTIHWLVPSKPGGGYDAYSRLLQPFMEQKLKARIVIENRFGAGGVVAAMNIRDATADGTTLGIINAPGLLAANMMAAGPAPNPARDFTLLGRVTSNRVVMFSAGGAGISDIDSLLNLSHTRPILVGVRDSGSLSFIAVPVTASLIGMDYALVTGYVGSTTRTLAALRGEVDIVLYNFESVRRFVESKELIPLLQISDPSSIKLDAVSQNLLAGVPILTGNEGFARRQAGRTGKTVEKAEQQAAALNSIFAAGRVVVAPPGLPEALAVCLSSALADVLNSAELLLAAKRANLSIDHRSPKAVREGLSTADRELRQFEPLIRAVLDQARQ